MRGADVEVREGKGERRGERERKEGEGESNHFKKSAQGQHNFDTVTGSPAI